MRDLNGDDQATLVYLVLLLVVIGGSMLIGSRKHLNATLQQMALWALIFVGAIGAYSVRDQIEAQLYPSRPQIMNVGTVSFNRARDGHFYAELLVNGAKIEFVIDTGASDIVLNRADAQRVGLAPDSLRFSGRANTANGVVNTAPIRLNEIVLGRFTDRNIRASVNSGDLDTSLLGMHYLGLFRKIEISGGRMTLTR